MGPFVDAENTTSGSSAQPDPPPPGPTTWRRDGPRFVLAAWAIATAAMTVAAVLAAIVLSVTATLTATSGGERSRERLREIAQDALDSKAAAWTTLIASQLALLACTWLACRFLRKPARHRLGLVASGLRPVQGAVLLAATIVPFALGLAAASLVSTVMGSSGNGASGLQRMWSEGSRGSSVAWILLIALLPGFAEEVFYRGLLLRGFLLRFGPAASILASSLLFAGVHGDLAWAAGIFPLGLWLGVVAWRTGSALLTFAMHASMNGLWTAGMMIVYRDAASESTLNAIAIGALAVGVIAFVWAIAILRRPPALPASVTQPQPLSFVRRVAAVAALLAALFWVLVPPGAEPPAPVEAPRRRIPAALELEASAAETVTCTALGDVGAVEFSLMPGAGARVDLPANRAGIDHVVVALDAEAETLWLAYAGESSGKGGKGRPLGVVEQLASGHPTVVCISLTQGTPPVVVRLMIEEDEALTAAAFERARAEGWAIRGRK